MAVKRRVIATIVGPRLSKQEVLSHGLNPKRFYFPLADDPDKLVTEYMRNKLAKSRGANREKIAQRIVKTAKTVQERRSNAAIRRTISVAPQQGIVTRARTRDFSEEFLARVEQDANKGTLIRKAGGKNKGKPSLRVRRSTAIEALDNRNRRLRGEHIPDGEYQAMMDYMAHYNDTFYEIMRGSPKVKGARIE
jgi:hypothetical protein